MHGGMCRPMETALVILKMGKMQKTYLICLIVTSSIVFSVCDALSVFAVSVINMPLSRFDLFIYYHSTYIKKVNLFV